MNRNNPPRGVGLFSVHGDTQSDKERNNVYEDVSGSVVNSTLNKLSKNYMAEAASQSILKAQGRTMLVSWGNKAKFRDKMWPLEEACLGIGGTSGRPWKEPHAQSHRHGLKENISPS